MSNIGYFSPFHEDELFYSGVARFAELKKYPRKTHLSMTLFGVRYLTPATIFPQYLDHFIDILPPNYKISMNELLNKHTLLPFYAPFISSDRVEKIIQCMRSGQGNPFAFTGMANSKIQYNKHLKYCPLCVANDREKYREAYWHRTHQISNLFLCPFHYELLIESHINSRNPSWESDHAWYTLESELSRYPDDKHQSPISFKENGIFKALSEDIHWVLTQKIGDYKLEDLHKRYMDILEYKGYGGFGPNSDSVRMKKIYSDFNNYFERETLQALGCTVNTNMRANWIKILFTARVNDFHNPIRHILIMRFLGFSISSFFTFTRINAPIFSLPYPCLNPVCPNYKQHVISNVQIRKNRRNEYLGLFECKCGYAYQINNKYNGQPVPKYSKIQIIKYGELWEKEFIRLWNSNTSVEIIEKSLRIGYVKAIEIGKSLPLGIPIRFKRTDIKLAPGKDVLSIIDNKRQQWLGLVNDSPGLCTEDIRKKKPALYSWLYKHDSEWLSNNRAKFNFTKPRKTFLDWEERDNLWSSQVEKAVENIITHSGKPRRICISSIGKEMGCTISVLYGNGKNKIPKTMQLIRKNIESGEDFAFRRLLYLETAYPKFSDLNIPQIIWIANLIDYQNNEKIQEELNRILSRKKLPGNN